MLHSQTPSQVAKDQVQIKLRWDKEKKNAEEEAELVLGACFNFQIKQIAFLPI